MVLKPRQSGVVAICDCGSKFFIPSESAIRTGIVYCPCGELEKIDIKVFNKIMQKTLNAFVAKNSGRPMRPTGKSEERHRDSRHGASGIQRKIDFEFEPLT